MMKIGAFAKLSGMTVKTLRHYDELGLLKPAYVEGNSGYRYYTADQLLTIRRIEGFKEQGLTLEMMRPLLAGAVSLTEAERTLLEKRRELESLIQKAQRQLEEIDERLVRMGRHGDEEEEKFSLRSVEPVLVASIRRMLPKGQLCLLIDELKQYVRLQGEDSDRELTIIRHRMADCDEEPSDIEVTIPISKETPAGGSVKIYRLPGVKDAPFFLVQQSLGRLRNGGRIINISSGVTRIAFPHIMAYNLTKGALNTFTLHLAQLLGPRGITVNAVMPGIVDTDINASWLHTPEGRKNAEDMSALGRVGEPADIADIVAFVASPDGRWVTGQMLDATGGSHL